MPFQHVKEDYDNHWSGYYSVAAVTGYIKNFLLDLLNDKDCSLIVDHSDGITSVEQYDSLVQQLTEDPKIVGALCTRLDTQPKNVLLLPLDDVTFESGLLEHLKNITRPPWDQRVSKVFWRGGVSPRIWENMRIRVVRELHNYEHADVKFTKWGNWEYGFNLPEEQFAPRCGLDEHCLFKYIMIIDGNVIASNHQWVFGSGSVPLMVTHPQNRFWFMDHLKPMVNYVPINYDLSDLKEKIQWLIANDEAAHSIMLEAMELAKTVFSSEFQKKYLRDSINDRLKLVV